VHNHRTVGLDVAQQALKLYGIDELGLDRIDRTVLDCLVNRFGGKPVGLSTLAVAVGEEQDTIDSVVEPYLIRLGLITKTPRGRQATNEAFKHMGKGPTDGLFR
jgi:Holliday junction DNA helicase RuvB